MSKIAQTFIVLCFCGLSYLQAQDATPIEVKKALDQKAPEAKAEWIKTAENQWQASYEKDGQEVVIIFDEKGNWLGTSSEISIKQLPQTILKALRSNYPDASITKVKMVEVVETPSIYNLEVSDVSGKIWLAIQDDGTILNTSRLE